jgi:hypothetical protein
MLRSGPGPRSLLFLALILAGCAARVRPVRPAAAAAPAAVAAVPRQLPAWLRPIVREQMSRQWDYVNELRWTAASLEFERTGALARQIEREVQCGHPGEGGDATELVPSSYLELEDNLRERAQALVMVASGANRRNVSDAYHALLDACTRCHSAYRSGQPLELPTFGER